MNNKHKYLLINTLIFTISSFATKLLSFFLVPIYTSVLTTVEYGYADLVTTSTTLLVYIFTLNISDAVVRFVIEDEDCSFNILVYAFQIVFIGACVCFVGVYLSSNVAQIAWPRYCYYFLFIIYLISALNGVLFSYARGINRIRQVGIAGVLASAITMISNIIFLLLLDWRLFGYMMASCFGTMASIIYLLIVLKISPAKLLFTKSCKKKTQKRMIHYSVPLIFNGIAWWLNSAFDRYSISFLMGVEQNGIYSVSSKIPLIISTINGIFGQAWGLSAIKDINEEDDDGFFSSTYNNYNCILVIMASGLIWLNIPIAKVLFSNEFFEAWKYSSILIISALFNALASVLGGAFTKTMRTDIYAKTSIISTIINVIMNLVLISSIGTIGAAIATTIAFIVLWFIRLILSRKYVCYRIPIIRQVITYFILDMQILLEHRYGRYTNWQILLLILVLIMNQKELMQLLKYTKNFITIKRNNKGYQNE